MTRTTLSLTLLLVATILLVGWTLQTQSDDEVEVEVPVEAVAPDAGMLTLEGLTFRITDTTEFGDDGEAAFALSDLTLGEEVEVEGYRDEAGALFATEIERSDDKLEVVGTIEEVGAEYLTVEGVRYTVTPCTEYEGFADLASIAIGSRVEVEYEEQSGNCLALEVEIASADDDDD